MTRTELILDERFPLPVSEGIRFEWVGGEPALFVFMSKPSAEEIRAYREQAISILYAGTETVFFLFHKTEATNWADTPFTPHLLPAEQLEMLRSSPAPPVLKLIAVDVDTQKIFAMRHIDLKREGDDVKIKGAVLSMLEYQFDAEKYDQSIARYYRDFPTSQGLYEHFVSKQAIENKQRSEWDSLTKAGAPLPLRMLRNLMIEDGEIARKAEQERTKLTVGSAAWNWFPFPALNRFLDQNRPGFSVYEKQFFSTLLRWRQTQGIYRFDPTAYDAIKRTRINNVPSVIYERLPQWCVYIEAPGCTAYGEEIHGFFAYLDYPLATRNTDDKMLIINILTPSAGARNFYFDLSQTTIRAGFVSAYKTIKGMEPDASIDTLSAEMEPLFALLLYLCTDDAEFKSKDREIRPTNSTVETKGKHKGRAFPANHATVWDVAWRVGTLIRNASRGQSEGRSGRQLKPHVRVPHLHWWRRGKRNDPSNWTYFSKWLPPIPVNAKTPDALIPVILDVKAATNS